MNKRDALKIVQESLPVYKHRERIVESIKTNPITLIVGETGSGKTTQIPQYLLSWKEITCKSKIVCTQPRTISATSIASRVSYEQNNVVGKLVGYQIRLDSQIDSSSTKLVYMTEGVLLRIAMSHKSLSDYRIVIIDEAHERTVNCDLLMGFIKEMIKVRADLRVVIMSATLDTDRFVPYFNNAPIIEIAGSLHPITHRWLSKPTLDYVSLTIETVLAIHNNSGLKGHILVFLTGQMEIEYVVSELRYRSDESTMVVYPLYASLRREERLLAFDEPNSPKIRKIVVATNIAETSLTIDNVCYVIDCGLSKQKVYSPSKGVEALGVACISKASVKQRIGRAGRVSSGFAYHLYTKDGYNNFSNETVAEILRSGLVSETLCMLALGISNPLQFDFIDSPDEMTMARAMNVLHLLSAIDENGAITVLGQQMAMFPVDPRMAKCILTSQSQGCCHEMIIIAAMIENCDKLYRYARDDGQDVSVMRRRKKLFYHIDGDHLTYLNVFNAYQQTLCTNNDVRKFCRDNYLDKSCLERANQIRKQLSKILCQNNDKNDICVFKLNEHRNVKYYENIIRTILSGYFMNAAVEGFGQKYWTFRVLTLDENGNNCIDIIDKASAHPTSVFYKNSTRNWIIFHEIQISQQTQLRRITAIKPCWLIDANPKYYNVESLGRDRSPIAKVLIASHYSNNTNNNI